MLYELPSHLLSDACNFPSLSSQMKKPCSFPVSVVFLILSEKDLFSSGVILSFIRTLPPSTL